MSTKANIVKLLLGELRQQGINVTAKGIKESLLTHPYYPSLQSISDYLSDLGAATMSVRISIDQLREALKEAQAFIFLEEKGESYPVIVKELNNERITYSSNGKKLESKTAEQLAAVWHGVSLLFQLDDAHSEESYKENRQQKKKTTTYLALSAIGLICLIGFSTYHYGGHNPLQFLGMLLPKLAGLFFAVLLAATELGFKLPVAEKLCAISTSDGCEKVLHSKASSITKDIKLADVGVVYFTSVILCMLFFDFSTVPLAWLSALTLPFVIFSVSYQRFVVKAHCPLCLSVMAMLVVDCIVYLLLGRYSLIAVKYLPSAILPVAGVFAIIGGFWMLVKQLLAAKQKAEREAYQLHQLRRHPDRIANAINSLQTEDMGNGTGDIILGSADAKVVVTEVLNPFCGPCGAAVNGIMPLLDMFPEGFQVRIRFIGRPEDIDSERAAVACHLISYAKTHSQEDVRKALVGWYASMAYESWRQRFTTEDAEACKDSLLEQIAWAQKAEIAYTPTTFVNGKRIPADIRLEDMRYWLGEVLE